MSDYGERLKALRKAKYPDFSEDMDMHDITDGMSWMADRIEELEAVLKKLEYWFDIEADLLEAMTGDARADHMSKLKLIRDTLTGGKDE